MATTTPKSTHHTKSVRSRTVSVTRHATPGHVRPHAVRRLRSVLLTRRRCYGGEQQEGSYAQSAPLHDEYVDWAPELINSVQLIGRAGSDAEMRVLPSGARVAKLNIAVKRPRMPDGAEVPPDWIEIEAWEELALDVCARVSKGTEVSMQGVLRIDKWEDARTGAMRSKPKVRLKSFQLVRPFGAAGEGAGAGEARNNASSSSSPARLRSPGEKYEHLIAHFDEYWDNRLTKRNPRAPDFKHKSTGTGIWVDSAPVAVLERLEELTIARGGDARPTMQMPGVGMGGPSAYAAGAFAGGDAYVADDSRDFGIGDGFGDDDDLDVPF
uniref:Single-stranded DNA-binding protein n=1 Tax=Pycnococcus provasolii TaxID=41880 RepID=A0A6U0BCG6_9CHLO